MIIGFFFKKPKDPVTVKFIHIKSCCMPCRNVGNGGNAPGILLSGVCVGKLSTSRKLFSQKKAPTTGSQQIGG